jgi:hypothetical protein
MSIYWIQTESDDVFAALDAVEAALTQGKIGTPPPALPAPVGEADPYLLESVASAHQTWAVDQSAIVMSSISGIGTLINRFQRVVRRATWWQQSPQWQQVNTFHAAVVRIIDVVLDRQRLHTIRLGQLESANTAAHIFALEQQIQALRDEQRLLRRRISQLEDTP